MNAMSGSDAGSTALKPNLKGVVRVDKFTTLSEKSSQQFSSWRKLVAPLMTVRKVDVARVGFHAKVEAHDLGRIHFAAAETDPMEYSHTLKHVRASGIDHWCLSLLKSGFDMITCKDTAIALPAGSLHLVSLTCPFRGRSGNSKSIRVFLGRDDFADMAVILDDTSMSQIDGPLAYIVKEYMLSMQDLLQNLPLSDLAVVTESFAHLLAATLKPSEDRLSNAKPAMTISRFNLARKFIQENLRSPELGTDSICCAVGISRRQVYYLFEQYGGVASFIKKQRLAACCRAIANANDLRLISSIAFSYGYLDAALFSRQFFAEFGFTPTEAREARLNGHLPPTTPPDTLTDWLLQRRGS